MNNEGVPMASTVNKSSGGIVYLIFTVIPALVCLAGLAFDFEFVKNSSTTTSYNTNCVYHSDDDDNYYSYDVHYTVNGAEYEVYGSSGSCKHSSTVTYYEKDPGVSLVDGDLAWWSVVSAAGALILYIAFLVRNCVYHGVQTSVNFVQVTEKKQELRKKLTFISLFGIIAGVAAILSSTMLHIWGTAPLCIGFVLAISSLVSLIIGLTGLSKSKRIRRMTSYNDLASENYDKTCMNDYFEIAFVKGKIADLRAAREIECADVAEVEFRVLSGDDSTSYDVHIKMNSKKKYIIANSGMFDYNAYVTLLEMIEKNCPQAKINRGRLSDISEIEQLAVGQSMPNETPSIDIEKKADIKPSINDAQK